MREFVTNTLMIGLTGQTGAGKSTVAKMFYDRGAAVLDADAIARDTIDSSNECLADLVLEFSTEVITPEGALNRKKLAQLCFSDPQKLQRLNEITYPHILRKLAEQIYEERLRGVQFLVLDAPTLFEAGLDKRCDTVVAVLADEDVRRSRIVARDHMSDEEARTRISAQKTDAFFEEHADFIVQNDGDMDSLHLSFIELWGDLEALLQKTKAEELTDAQDAQEKDASEPAQESPTSTEE